MDPAAAAMGPEEVQEDLIRRFSERAAKLMPSHEGSLPLAAAAAMAALVVEATAQPGLFDYSSLVCLPAISWLKHTQYHWHLDALTVFAYGTLKDYRRHKDRLPELNDKQLEKLKDITLLTSLEARKMIPLDDLMEELDVKSMEELTAYLEQSYERLGFGAKLYDETRLLEVTYAPQIHGRPSYGQSLEVYLQASTVCHADAQTGILSNDIATQVKVPLSRGGRYFCWKVDFKPRGSGIFLQLIGLTTDGHLSGRSWNGLLFPGMYGMLNGQIFLRPGAAAWRKITDQNSQNDYGSIDHMLGCYSGIKFRHLSKSGKPQQIMYPIYVDNLRSHLKGQQPRLSQVPHIRALDVNLITFFKCHPSLLTTSARSVVSFHIRKEYKSVNTDTQGGFSIAIRSANPKRYWKRLEHRWLFSNVFQYARDRGSLYQNNATDCHRCIRDWETHVREHFTDEERHLFTTVFTTVILTYLVEHYFDDFIPEILYHLLCGPQNASFDLKDWLSKLQRLAPNDVNNAVQGHQGA
ncbi:unnamed protein product [Urochloa humidicola]